MYDITYEFIKGTYQNLSPNCEIPSEVTVSSSERNSIEISVVDEDSFAGDVKAEVVSCTNGRAQVAATKQSIIFVPDDGFVGEAEILLSVTDGHNVPMEYTLVLHVVNAEDMVSETPSAETSQPSTPTEASFPWWILLCVVWGVAALLAVVLLIRKKK